MTAAFLASSRAHSMAQHGAADPRMQLLGSISCGHVSTPKPLQWLSLHHVT
jgi:hypothetical protein